MLVAMEPVTLIEAAYLQPALNHILSRIFQEFHRISTGAIMNFSSTLRTPFRTPNSSRGNGSRCDLFQPIRQWLDRVEVRSPKSAHRIAKLIPAQCPFEREVKLFGQTVARIPPLCKLNPLYDQFVGLRFRALCYLADECGEDIQQYC